MMRNPKFEWQDAFLKAGLRPSSCVTVGIAIANRWNGDDNHPIVSVPSLMDATGLRSSAVEKALRKLRTEGWIAQVERGGRRGTETRASRYRLVVPNPYAASLNPYNGKSQPVQTYAPTRTNVRTNRPVTRPDSIDPSAQVETHSEQPCPRPLAQVDYSLAPFPVETGVAK